MSTSKDLEKQLQREQEKLLGQQKLNDQSWQLWKRINPGFDPAHTEHKSASQRQHIDFPDDWKDTADKTHFLKKNKYSEFVEARARFALLSGEKKAESK